MKYFVLTFLLLFILNGCSSTEPPPNDLANPLELSVEYDPTSQVYFIIFYGYNNEPLFVGYNLWEVKLEIANSSISTYISSDIERIFDQYTPYILHSALPFTNMYLIDNQEVNEEIQRLYTARKLISDWKNVEDRSGYLNTNNPQEAILKHNNFTFNIPTYPNVGSTNKPISIIYSIPQGYITEGNYIGITAYSHIDRLDSEPSNVVRVPTSNVLNTKSTNEIDAASEDVMFPITYYGNINKNSDTPIERLYSIIPETSSENIYYVNLTLSKQLDCDITKINYNNVEVELEVVIGENTYINTLPITCGNNYYGITTDETSSQIDIYVRSTSKANTFNINYYLTISQN